MPVPPETFPEFVRRGQPELGFAGRGLRGRPEPSRLGGRMTRAELEIRPEELKSRLDKGDALALVDVRQPGEFEYCRLAGSRLVPLDQLPHSLDELDPADEIITICHHGVRSLDAAYFLRMNGFPSAKSLAGGLDHWSIAIDRSVPRY